VPWDSDEWMHRICSPMEQWIVIADKKWQISLILVRYDLKIHLADNLLGVLLLSDKYRYRFTLWNTLKAKSENTQLSGLQTIVE
jgi:hypothetical protein